MNTNFELFDYIYDGICIIDSEYKIIFWNSSVEIITGIKRKDIVNAYLTERFSAFNHPKYRLRIELLFSQGTPVIISTQLHKTIFNREINNLEIFQEITISRIPAEKKNEYYAILNIKDITELSDRINDYKKEHKLLLKEITQRKKLEIKLRKSLEEKEILIKEVHHRVKNNLLLITSLIDMQTWKLKEENTISILDDLKKRIDSISLIHEKLYRSKDMTSICSKEYLEDLLNNFKDSMLHPEWEIKIIPKIDKIQLTIDTTIPLGLLVTEMITNSLKYAFINNKKGEIVVELTKNQDTCKLIVSDTGSGFPIDFDRNKTDSLGWILIEALSSQLKGKHEISNNGGAVHIITFPTDLHCEFPS